MLETIEACPICKHTNFTPIVKCKDFTVSQTYFEVVACQQCDFHFTNPRPNIEQIGQYYQSETYISHSNTRKGIINQLYHWVRQITLRRKVKLINGIYPKKGNILDIGTGTGYFLAACQNNGWQVMGTEPDEKTRLQAEKNTQKPIVSHIFDETLQNQKYQVITLWHVLEHIHTLHESIEQLKKLLADDGKLIIAVPNHNSYDRQHFQAFWAAYDLPRHLYHFTHKHIEQLFNTHGFTLLKVQPMYFDAYYIALMSHQYQYGKSRFLQSFYQGWRSNRYAAKNQNNYSSNVYILEKKSN
ncbi:MAG: methyltransferase domain-containing protein [Cytophagales bacterium]|nr:MAG: methyltransferase domain-containing protein [Cytophagales bacterium]